MQTHRGREKEVSVVVGHGDGVEHEMGLSESRRGVQEK